MHIAENISLESIPHNVSIWPLIGEGDCAVDLIAALLAVGWGAAEPGGDGIGSWSVGILVGGLERTQGIDVLIIG